MKTTDWMEELQVKKAIPSPHWPYYEEGVVLSNQTAHQSKPTIWDRMG
jgi:hypothetical protein